MPIFDNHSNLASSTVLTAPSPATSGTTVTVQSGDGARFPSANFPVTMWPSGSQPTPANAEIAYCTSRSTDTLTITRAQEGTSAQSVATGWNIAATITAKTITDLETAFTGDSGSGGSKGLVPAPAAGDAAASKFLSAAGTWATAGGASNWYPSVSDNCGANSTFLNTGASFIDGGVATVAWDSSSRAIKFDTTTTANSGAEARLKPNGNYFSWANTNYYHYWEVADISISALNGGLFFGAGSMDSYGAGFTYTNPHVGFRRAWSGGSATTYASSANNTANTAVSFTPTNNNTNANVLAFYRTSTSVKCYDVLSGTLVATITTNIYTGGMSNIAVLGVSNAATATAIRALLYGFSMSRQATF